jgi:hypothetical protein
MNLIIAASDGVCRTWNELNQGLNYATVSMGSVTRK